MHIQPPRSILKVSELNAEVALLLQSGFPLLWVEGEISNLSRPASGHLYFSLKDSKAQVRCAMFKHKNLRLRLKPENGMKVLARATVGLYEARGEFQLVVEHMEDAGTGQLQQAFDTLKEKLHAAGFFDLDKKKKLPTYPKRIGIITSPSGAAIQDIIHVLQRRCPQIPLLIYPVAVQGEQASQDIIRAIQQADQDQRCDLLLLARGGGSIEDLWCFNEEAVAHAIFSAKTPIVSGIGHETDFTIADFVSDQRAPTPSAAAELISPDKQELQTTLAHHRQRLNLQIQRTLELNQTKLNHLQRRLIQQNSLVKIQQYSQRTDDLFTQLERNVQRQLIQQGSRLQHLEHRLFLSSPGQLLPQHAQQLHSLYQRLFTAIQHRQQRAEERLYTLSARLNGISPLATLQRGYAIVRQQDKKEAIIHSIKQVTTGKLLNIQLTDGDFDCQVLKPGNSGSST